MKSKIYITIVALLCIQSNFVQSAKTTNMIIGSAAATSAIAAAQAFQQHTQNENLYLKNNISPDNFFKRREQLQKRLLISLIVVTTSTAAGIWSYYQTPSSS